MTETTGEFATQPVPEERTVSWLRVGCVSAMVSFSLPGFIAGIEVARALPGERFIGAILLGALITTLIGTLMGGIGAHSRLSSYMLTRIAFGDKGAAVVNIAFGISLLGWFGVNIDLFGAAVARLVADYAGDTIIDGWLIEVVAGLVMTITTLFGFRAINMLSFVLVPVLMSVTALLLFYSLDNKPFELIMANLPATTVSYGDAVSSVVGGIIVGAVILPDITRFIRHWPGAVYTVILSYFLVSSVVMIAGALAAVSLNNNDLLDIMLILGIGFAAFAIVIFGSWILNSLNLYSAMLSVQATVPKIGERTIVFTLGALGTLAAFLNILDYFLDFLFYLAIVFVPVAGIVAVDYLVTRKSAYQRYLNVPLRSTNVAALMAWLAGAVIALVGAKTGLSVSGVAAIDAMVVSSFGYWLLSRQRNMRADHT